MSEDDAPPGDDAAWERFLAGLRIDYERWHDGVGFDLASIPALSPLQQRRAVDLLRTRELTWRELDALAQLDTPEAWEAIDEAVNDPQSTMLRFRAASLQAEHGRRSDLSDVIVRELKRMERSDEGETAVLLAAREHDSPRVRMGLLWASWNRTPCAPNAAALLLFLTGHAADPLALEHRDIVLGLGPHENSFVRGAAMEKLERLVGITRLDLDELL